MNLVDRFGKFLSRAFGVTCLVAVSASQVEAFVRSTSSDGAIPSVATMRLRRSTLRSLFRTARELGLVDGDPTLDLALPSRTNEAARPLTDLEVQRCRRVALEDLTSTRLAVPWALGEATARTAEIPHVACRRPRSRAAVGSGSTVRATRKPRWGVAHSVGCRPARAAPPRAPRCESTTAVVDVSARSENPESRRAHSSQAIRETLRRAGLTGGSDCAAGVAGGVGRPPGAARDGSDR